MKKQEILEKNIQSLGKVAIAYSGGIDSSYLLYVANQVLPQENVIAIIANGIMIARKDYEEAIQFLKENNFRYIEVPYKPLEITEFKENHKDRCYHCKKKLMTILKKVANENGYEHLLDGKNADDLTVYRPGNKATEEVGVISPLAKFEFHKEEIFVAILSDIVAASRRFRLYVLRNLRICGKICIFVGVYLRIKG